MFHVLLILGVAAGTLKCLLRDATKLTIFLGRGLFVPKKTQYFYNERLVADKPGLCAFTQRPGNVELILCCRD
jgi:hypothetical protein